MFTRPTSVSPTDCKLSEGWNWSALAHHGIPNAQESTRRNWLTEYVLHEWMETQTDRCALRMAGIAHSNATNAIVTPIKSYALVSNLDGKGKIMISK